MHEGVLLVVWTGLLIPYAWLIGCSVSIKQFSTFISYRSRSVSTGLDLKRPHNECERWLHRIDSSKYSSAGFLSILMAKLLNFPWNYRIGIALYSIKCTMRFLRLEKTASHPLMSAVLQVKTNQFTIGGRVIKMNSTQFILWSSIHLNCSLVSMENLINAHFGYHTFYTHSSSVFVCLLFLFLSTCFLHSVSICDDTQSIYICNHINFLWTNTKRKIERIFRLLLRGVRISSIAFNRIRYAIKC